MRHAAQENRKVMSFKNGFKFHFDPAILRRSSYCTLSAVRRCAKIYSALLCHLAFGLRSSQWQRSFRKKNIANILRKSDQLRGIREEQIKDLKSDCVDCINDYPIVGLKARRKLKGAKCIYDGSEMRNRQ